MDEQIKALSIPKTNKDTQRFLISLAIIIACTILVSVDKIGVESFIVMVSGVSVFWLGLKSETTTIEESQK